MSIKKVRIQNYKGLEDLEFEPSRINIFVGRNNTGKSSALEAIALALSATNGFRDALGEDILSLIIKRRMPERWNKGLKPIKYFVKLGTEEGHVYVEIDGKSLRLDLQFLEKGVPESDAGDKFYEFMEGYSWEEALEEAEEMFYMIPRALLKKEKEGFFKDVFERKRAEIKKRTTPSSKLFVIGRLSENIISEVAYAAVSATEEVEEIIDSSGNVSLKPGRQWEVPKRFDVLLEHEETIPLLFKISSVNEAEEVKGMLGELVRENKQEEAIGLIRNEVEYFKDLREVSGELLCSLTTGTVPLSFMGDGFLALLDIIFMRVLAEAVFIEEPETCLHPGFLDVAARQIVNSAERTQFFIATHNAELLEYLLEAGKDHLELFRFVRLYQMPDGELSYEVLTGKEAAEEIFEIKTDLRGI
jgi:AAA15 family ATPase/GTPase